MSVTCLLKQDDDEGRVNGGSHSNCSNTSNQGWFDEIPRSAVSSSQYMEDEEEVYKN
jgi:hypothetical protein